MNFYVITLFPEVIETYLNTSVLGRAKSQGLIKVDYFNPRNYTDDDWQTVDDKPYGGGPGMVMLAKPILQAWKEAVGRKKSVKTYIFSPHGQVFNNKIAKNLATEAKHIVLIAGRYEGIDDRVRTITKAEELSVGEFVLTGGEVPAMLVIDAISRQIPGTLGKYESLEEERIAGRYVFTRPADLRWGRDHYEVPSVLLSGNHKSINEWREKSKNDQGLVN